MNNAIKVAKALLKKGYNVIPTNSFKQPIGCNWNKFQQKPMQLSDVDNYFKEHYNVAILTGGNSRVVCLDADMKYDVTGDMWERFLSCIPEEILTKVMCQSTQNKGYHLVFKAPAKCLVGNEKLASRYTTASEKHETYLEHYKDIDTRDTALKTAINDSQRVLFETRSGTAENCGGYFLVAPSVGYQHVFGTTGEVTEDEYDILMSAARSFNEVKIFNKDKEVFADREWEVSPFDDYNDKTDVLSLLTESGWSIVEENRPNAKDIKLLRPGKSFNKHSAIYDTISKILCVYSSSTSFDMGKGYTATGVFIHLECNGDASEAYKKLVSMGYGK